MQWRGKGDRPRNIQYKERHISNGSGDAVFGGVFGRE